MEPQKSWGEAPRWRRQEEHPPSHRSLRLKGPLEAWKVGEGPQLAAVVSANKTSWRCENGWATEGDAGGTGRKSLRNAWGPQVWPRTPNRCISQKKGVTQRFWFSGEYKSYVSAMLSSTKCAIAPRLKSQQTYLN